MNDERRTIGGAGGLLALAIVFAMLGIAAAALGATLVYLFDPDRGNARRTQLLDRASGAARRTARRGDGWTDDLTAELEAVPHELSYRALDEPISDDILVDRVRAELGHQVKHASAVEVRATNGVITLSGPVLAGEMTAVLATAHTVPGVRQVDDRLQVHDGPDSIPALQD